METPQLENGFLRIANDIAKYLAKTYMSSYESQILWAIFIKTYGFNKKEDWISNSQFVELTGMHKAHVSRTIKKLIQRRIVTQTGNKISFQKDSTLWCKLPKQATVTHSGNPVTQTGLKVTQMGQKLPKQADTIDNIQKTITKDINTVIAFFKSINPSYEVLFRNTTQRGSTERLIKQYGIEKLSNLISRLPTIMKNQFAPKITSPYELELKMAKLLIFLQQEETKPNKWAVTKI